jgi:hypothetical protein
MVGPRNASWFALRKLRPTTNLISNRPHKAETRNPQRSHVGYAATGGWVTVYVPRLLGAWTAEALRERPQHGAISRFGTVDEIPHTAALLASPDSGSSQGSQFRWMVVRGARKAYHVAARQHQGVTSLEHSVRIEFSASVMIRRTSSSTGSTDSTSPADCPHQKFQ